MSLAVGKRTVGKLAVLSLAAAAGLVATTTLGVPAVSAAPAFADACARVVTPGAMRCMAIRRVTPSGRDASPGAKPDGYGPGDLRSAYNVPGGAGGVTVAITDAYDDQHAESDLQTYRSTFGLPACTTGNGCFRKVNQKGATSPLPRGDTGWAGEVSLDVDMVSAICPKCHILLVEARSAQDSDLLLAIDRAVAMGARYVSNSWGGDEASNQTRLDKHLNHPGVAITVSTGDDGYGAEYPATSRFVTAVGGTTLRRSSTSRGWSETVWNDAGSGCSRFDAKPVWQTVATTCSKRAEADVSAIADPSTGVAVYQTYGGSGWAVYGGTSTGTPIVAAMYALAGKPGRSDYPASYPYAQAGNFFDVTSGHNGNCGTKLCGAAAGWDGPTGLGTPDGVAGLRASNTGATGLQGSAATR